MKLESQVTSLELSKRLKELGVRQESNFYWKPIMVWNPETKDYTDKLFELVQESDIHSDTFDGRGSINWGEKQFENQRKLRKQWDERLSAFTVAELGEMLPKNCQYVKRSDGKRWVLLETGENCETCDEPICNTGPIADDMISDTEADCRAKILIYLIEQGIVKP